MDRGVIRYERVYFKKEQICIKDDNFLKGYSEYEIPERKTNGNTLQKLDIWSNFCRLTFGGHC